MSVRERRGSLNGPQVYFFAVVVHAEGLEHWRLTIAKAIVVDVLYAL